MRLQRLFTLFAFFILSYGNSSLLAQTIDLTLRFNSATGVYEVYGQPNFTNANYFVGGGVQISVVLPAEVADTSLTVTTIAGGTWFDNSQIYAPTADTQHDFHGIASNGSFIALEAGVEILLFTFSLPSGNCVAGLRLFENTADPQYDDAGMQGGDFRNYFASAFDFTNIYNTNYDNAGTICNPPFVITNPLTILQNTSGQVCFHAIEVDGDPMMVSICNGSPQNGTATATISGSEICVDYTPSTDYIGQDSVCIIVCDDTGLCDTSSVPITVIPALPPSIFPEPPTVIETPITVIQDSIITLCSPILDPNVGDTFTASLCTNSPDHGTANLSVNGNYLCITYTPDLGYSGTDKICAIVCDQTGLCDTASFPINVIPTIQPPSVPQPPIVIFPPLVGPEDSIITDCGPINDPNVGDIFSATICGQPANGTATLMVDNNADQLCITIDPDDNFVGNDTLCVIVCDQTGLCDTLIIPIVITPNEPFAPPVIITNPITIIEDGIGNVCATITDPNDGDTFTINSCGASQGTETLTLIGNQLCIAYEPNAGYNGTDSICLIACDQRNKCDTTFIPVNVVAPIPASTVARPPIVIASPITTLVNNTINICTPIVDPNVGDTFSASLCAGSPANGMAVATVSGQALCLSFTPSNGFQGTAPLCAIICDQSGLCDTVTYLIEVIPVPIQPENVQNPIVITTPIITVADSTVTICGPVNDANVFDTHTVTVCQQAAHGVATATINNTTNSLCVTLDPEPGYAGSDSICVNICDQNGDCDQLVIPITILPSYTTFNLKVLLQGALIGESSAIMQDSLRAKNLIPTSQPYGIGFNPRFNHVGETGGMETTTSSILSANAGTADAVVDWVFVELRSTDNPSTIIRTFSGLVQRDGDVIDGINGMPMQLAYLSGSFYVSIKHRNHLGIMTASPIQVLQQQATIDFTMMTATDLYNTTGYDGLEAITLFGKTALWAGNSNMDNKVKYDGIENDRIIITSELLNYPANTSQTLNFDNAFDYFPGDINMNGQTKYDGSLNDRMLIQNIILNYPLNTSMVNNFHPFFEQIPE